MSLDNNELYFGVLDGIDGQEIIGWAWCPEQPGERVEVGIFEGDRLVCRARADQHREDLLKAGKGDGSYGFRIAVPATLADGGEHALTARILPHDAPLQGQPVVFRADPAGQLRFGGHFDFLRGHTALGWAWDSLRPNDPVFVDVYLNDEFVIRVRADGMRPDLRDAGLGNGRHGFSVAIPMPAEAVGAVQVHIRIAGTDFELQGSPRECFVLEAPLDQWRSAGKVSGIADGCLEGTLQSNAPSTEIELYDDGRFLRRLTVALEPALGSARWAAGTVSRFRIPVPAELCDGELHAIGIRSVEAKQELEGSPVAFRCPDPAQLCALRILKRFDSVYALMPPQAPAELAEFTAFLGDALPLVIVSQSGQGADVTVPDGGNLGGLAQAHCIALHKRTAGHRRSLILLEDESLLAASMLTPASARLAVLAAEGPLADLAVEVADATIDLRPEAPEVMVDAFSPGDMTKRVVAVRTEPFPVPTANLRAALCPSEGLGILRRKARCAVVVEMNMDHRVDYALLEAVIAAAADDVRFLLAGTVANNLDGQLLRRLMALADRRNVHLIPSPGVEESRRLSQAADVAFFPMAEAHNEIILDIQEKALRYALGGARPVMNQPPLSSWIREFTTVEADPKAIIAALEPQHDRKIHDAARRCAYARWLGNLSIEVGEDRAERILDITRLAHYSGQDSPWQIFASA